MTTIGFNPAAMRAANASYAADKMVGTAMERLSTGKQINSAKDNASGLAVVTSMTSQIRGMGQGIRNLNDGISLAQTTEGVLNDVTNMLQRIREVATQAASGTYTADDQKSIQYEVASLTTGIANLTQNSQFNGIKLFDTDALPSAGVVIQAGADGGDSMTIEKPHIDAARISGDAFTGLKVDVKTDRSSMPATMQYLKGASDAATGSFVGASPTSGGYAAMKQASFAAASAYVTGVTQNIVPLTADQTSSLTNIQTLKANAETQSATLAAGDPASPGYSTLVQNAHNASVTYLSAVKAFSVSVPGETSTVPDNLFYLNGAADATASMQASVKAGGFKQPALDVAAGLAATVYDKASAESGRANSLKTLDNVDSLLKTVTSARTNLGAVQNRMDSAINALTSNVTNLSAARSNIEDADYSKEATALAKAQVLSQASAAMLAQANQSQQNVMSLLKG